MTKYFDNQGWLTTEILPDRKTDVSPPSTKLPDGFAWNFTGYSWVAAERNPRVQEVVPSIPKDLRITGVAFKRRLTSDERISIRKAAEANDRVFDYLDLLNSAPVIRLDDPDVIEGLGMLESVGVLSKGRSKEILTNPIREEERPNSL